MKSGVEHLAKHPGWKSKGKRKKSAAKSSSKVKHMAGCMAYKGIRCICKQIKEKHETPGCTCAERSWYGTGHDSACPLGDVVAPSGKRITKQQAEARAGLIPESDWEEQEEETNVAAVKLSADDWVEIYYALEDKLDSSAVKGDARWKRHLRAIKEALGPDGTLAAESEYFDESELATVLAALRHWQRSILAPENMPAGVPSMWAELFSDAKPLNATAIDALCERLNCGD